MSLCWCLNEAGALPWVLSRMPSGYRPIVADNGSTDGSAAIAAAYGAYVVPVPQRGFGAACHAGLLAASSDIVRVMDADASFDPRDLPTVADPVAAGRRRSHAGPPFGPGQRRVAAARQDRQLGAGRRAAPPHRRPGPRSWPDARRPAGGSAGPADVRPAVRLSAGDGGPRGRGGLADRGNGRAVLPADRQIEGHRHARRHGAGRRDMRRVLATIAAPALSWQASS